MKTLRIIAAGFMVFLGAMMVIAWSAAGRAVEGIEDGSAITRLTAKMLDDPEFADAAAGRVTDRIVEQTDGRFIGRLVVAFEPELQRAIANVLASDRVEQAVTTGLEKAEQRLTAEITDPDRPSGPLVISVDLSDRVNARIDEIPVIGAFIPEVTVPPIEREIVDAETFDSVRQVYSGLKIVAGWGLIAAIALLVGGYFVAPRSRWYWPQALVGAGFVVLAISIAVRRIVPAQIASAVPGGETSGGGTFLSNFVADNASGPIANRLLQMALVAVVLALLFALAARYLPERIVALRASRSAAPDTVVAETTAAPVVPAEVAAHEQVVETVPIEPAEHTTPPDTAEPMAAAAHAQAADTVPIEPVEPGEPARPAAKPATAVAKKPAAKKPAAKKPAAAKSAPAEKPAPRTSSRARKPAPPKE